MAHGTAFDVHLVTPDSEVWAGTATFLVARSAAGDVGILAGHEPMLSILGIGPVTIERDGEDPFVAVCDGGFLSVGRNPEGETRVDVLAEHVAVESEIDAGEIARFENSAAQLRAAGDEDGARVEAAKADARRRIKEG